MLTTGATTTNREPAITKKTEPRNASRPASLTGERNYMEMKLKKISKMDLADVLKNHMHWLNEDCEGWESMRADLSRMDLNHAELNSVNLQYADLNHANLEGAYLTWACLSKANLQGANLCNAWLDETDLREADLKDADLRGAHLRRADVTGANLSFSRMDGVDAGCSQFGHSNMRYVSMAEGYFAYANFSDTNLSDADIRDADLHWARLDYAVLRGARFAGAQLKNVSGLMMACPSDGAFVGWKKAKTEENRPALIKLEIPEDARRLSGATRQCRCDKAKVLKVFDEFGEEIDKAHSIYDPDFVYEVGATVTPDGFIEDRWEWGSGIYFFITRKEAEDYRW